jgi:hypothetical protein
METRAVERDDRGDRTAVEWGAAGRPLVVARRARAARVEALAALAMLIINSSARRSGKGATCTCASSSRGPGAPNREPQLYPKLLFVLFRRPLGRRA